MRSCVNAITSDYSRSPIGTAKPSRVSCRRCLSSRPRIRAPIIGLLGTVIGIVRSFSALGENPGSARYLELSKGVSEALVNTAGGLAIGIPALIFYAFFRGRAQRLISELESAVTHVLALMSLQYNKRTERAPVLLEDEF